MEEIRVFSGALLEELHQKARANERLRTNLDLRTTVDDQSQRMLNVLEPGTKVAIHRHADTSESVVCLEGCLDWIFYQELPNMNAGDPVCDNDKAIVESNFKEIARVRVCPREKLYGIQVPKGAWHSIEVYEPSAIMEAKDGAYLG